MIKSLVHSSKFTCPFRENRLVLHERQNDGGIAVLDVDVTLRLALAGEFLPKDLAIIKIEADHFPLVNVFGGLVLVAAEIEPFFRFLGFSFVDGRGEEHTVSPDHGRGPSASSDVAFP